LRWFLLLIFQFQWAIAAGVTEKSYNAHINKALLLFGPYVAFTGNILSIEKRWQSELPGSSVNYAHPPIFEVVLNGAAFRTPTMTDDGMAFMICHEIGHIIGGDPKYSPGYWPSVEGQASYAASNLCLREFFKDEDNSETKAPLVVTQECSKTYSDREEASLCIRTVMAGYIFAENYRQFKLLPGEFHKEFPPISFEKKDPSEVRETNRSYPSPQCQFDTAFAAALCEKGKNFTVDVFRDPDQFTCTRPRCWYGP
jgi:hypothetical protein